MTGKVTDLFYLVKSLSRSEWSVIHQSIGKKSIHGDKAEDEMQVFKLLKHLKAALTYEEDNVREKLGYKTDRKSKKAFSRIKNIALDIVFSAIEQSKENQNPKTLAQKAPTLISQMINRGLFFKASFFIEKYLGICDGYELFNLKEQLLSLKRHTLLLLPPPEVDKSLDAICEQEKIARNCQAEIVSFLNIKEKIRSIRKQSMINRKELINNLASSVELQQTHFGSKRAELHFLHTLRQIRLLQRDTSGWVAAVNGIISIVEDNKYLYEEDAIFRVYVETLFGKIRYTSMGHDFENSLSQLAKAKEAFESLPLGKSNWVKEKQILSEIHLYRLKLDAPPCVEAIRKGVTWYKENPGFLESGGFQVFARLSFESLFIFSQFEDCGRLLVLVRQPKPSLFHPIITCVSWMVTLLLRIEQKDWELLEYDCRAAERYFKKYCSDLGTPFILVNLVKKFLRQIHGETSMLWKEAEESLSGYLELNGGQKIEDYFPFSVWAKSKNSRKTFLSLLTLSNKPIKSF